MSRALWRAAWALILCLTVGLAVMNLAMTVTLRAPEKISYQMGVSMAGLPGLALMLLAETVFFAWLLRAKRMRAGRVAFVLWTVCTTALLLSANTKQIVDFQYVCDAARQFAQGDYSPLQGDYFQACSYQLGVCFLLEGVARLFPSADLNLLMQGVNTVLSAGTAWMLSAWCVADGRRRETQCAAQAMYLLCLPLALYGIHVYGTIPMAFFCAAAALCFSRYVQTGRIGYGGGYALCAALAYMIKPNAAIMLAALLICAALYTMESGDWKGLACAVLGVLLAIGLKKLVMMQYELRSGMALRRDVSMLARLMMGLQDGPRAAGWYTGYVEQFFSGELTAAQEKAVVTADLHERLAQMAGDPIRTLIFFVQKAVSQWLEPTYGTLLYGNAAHTVYGYAGGVAQAVFHEGSALRHLLEGYMKAWQQTLYILAGIGLCDRKRRWRGAGQMLLPVFILGGFLYHMLFEAKSQYIYVYALFMVPLAAHGLSMLGDGIRRIRTK